MRKLYYFSDCHFGDACGFLSLILDIICSDSLSALFFLVLILLVTKQYAYPHNTIMLCRICHGGGIHSWNKYISLMCSLTFLYSDGEGVHFIIHNSLIWEKSVLTLDSAKYIHFLGNKKSSKQGIGENILIWWQFHKISFNFTALIYFLERTIKCIFCYIFLYYLLV